MKNSLSPKYLFRYGLPIFAVLAFCSQASADYNAAKKQCEHDRMTKHRNDTNACVKKHKSDTVKLSQCKQQVDKAKQNFKVMACAKRQARKMKRQAYRKRYNARPSLSELLKSSQGLTVLQLTQKLRLSPHKAFTLHKSSYVVFQYVSRQCVARAGITENCWVNASCNLTFKLSSDEKVVDGNAVGRLCKRKFKK